MRHDRIAAIVAVLALVTGCGTQSFDVGAEGDAIRDAWEGVSAAFQDEDWARYRQYFVQEPRFQLLHPAGREWISGWDAFSEIYEERIASGSDWDFATNRFDVHVAPSGDVAWTTIEVVLTQSGQTQTSWQLAVWEKTEGRWRVAAASASPVPPGDTVSE